MSGVTFPCWHEGASSPLAFPDPAEIALVHLDFPGQLTRLPSQLLDDHGAELVVKCRRSDFVYADQKAGRAGRCPGNEVLKQLIGLEMREFLRI